MGTYGKDEEAGAEGKVGLAHGGGARLGETAIGRERKRLERVRVDGGTGEDQGEDETRE